MAFEEGLDKLECITDHKQDEELVKELGRLSEGTKKLQRDIGPLSSDLPKLKSSRLVGRAELKLTREGGFGSNTHGEVLTAVSSTGRPPPQGRPIVIPRTRGRTGHVGASPYKVEHHVCHKPNWQVHEVQQLRRL